jgi:hypothetical protein
VSSRALRLQSLLSFEIGNDSEEPAGVEPNYETWAQLDGSSALRDTTAQLEIGGT